MNDDQFVELLNRLRGPTTAEEIHWERTMWPDQYRVFLEGGFVQVGLRRDWNPEVDDYDGLSYPFATLHDDRGHQLEERTAPRELIDEVLTVARRSAGQSDRVLQRMLRQLAEVKR